jgi:hypothetical protein
MPFERCSEHEQLYTAGGNILVLHVACREATAVLRKSASTSDSTCPLSRAS